MAHDVFVSHSAKDKTTANAVCAVLESSGVRCWMAPRDVTPGMEWGECVIEAIEQSRIMVLVFTADANASPQIRREVERAVSHSVAILPLRIQDVVPGRALEYFIGNVHWLDALTPPLEAHLKSLAGTVKILLARMPGTPVPTETQTSGAAEPPPVSLPTPVPWVPPPTPAPLEPTLAPKESEQSRPETSARSNGSTAALPPDIEVHRIAAGEPSQIEATRSLEHTLASAAPAPEAGREAATLRAAGASSTTPGVAASARQPSPGNSSAPVQGLAQVDRIAPTLLDGPEPSPRRSSRGRLIAGASALLLLGVIGAYFAPWRRQAPGTAPQPPRTTNSQSTSVDGSLLIISDANAEVSLDGRDIGAYVANQSQIVPVSIGHHVVAAMTANGITEQMTVDITSAAPKQGRQFSLADEVAHRDYLAALAQQPGDTGEYKILKTARVGGEGGEGTLFGDTAGRRLYITRYGTPAVPATGTALAKPAVAGRIAVFDLDTLAPVGEIPGNPGYSVAVDAASGRGLTSGNPVFMFDTKRFVRIKTIDVGEIAPGGIDLDAFNARAYLFNPTVEDAAVIDAKDGTVLGRMHVGLGAAATVFDGNGTLYLVREPFSEGRVDLTVWRVEKPSPHEVKHYSLDGIQSCSGIALDAKNHLLFAACTLSGGSSFAMVILSAENGAVLARLPIAPNPNDVVFNPSTMEAFSMNSEGMLTVVREKSPTSFEVVENLQTMNRAHRMALDYTTNRILTASREFVSGSGRGGPIPGSFTIMMIGK